MSKKILLILILLISIGCDNEKAKQEWNPIFEETHFEYLETNINRSLSLINDLYEEADNDRKITPEKLHQTKNRLLELKDYYIPLTTIRQKIYDAERYFKLNDMKKSRTLLNDSKSIIISLELKTRNKVFDKVILDLNAVVNEAVASLDNDDRLDTYNKMKRLGEHVNLMLYRGDLILSGVEFDE